MKHTNILKAVGFAIILAHMPLAVGANDPVLNSEACASAMDAVEDAVARDGLTLDSARAIRDVLEWCEPAAVSTSGSGGDVADGIVIRESATASDGLTTLCRPGTAIATELAMKVILVVGGATYEQFPDGNGYFAYRPGTSPSKEFFAHSLEPEVDVAVEIYEFQSFNNGNGTIVIAGVPMTADAADADGGCGEDGSLCRGNGWATATRPGLSVTMTGFFDKCR